MARLIVVYQPADEGLSFVGIAPGVDPASVVAQVVPAGAAHAIVDEDALPSDPVYRAAWVADWSSTPPAFSIDPAGKQVIDRRLALADVESWFKGEIAAGFQTAGGWTLGLTPEDVTLLTGNFVLAKESDALGGPIPPVIDRDGIPHEMQDLAELTAIMLAYGQRRAEISAEYAARKAAIGG